MWPTALLRGAISGVITFTAGIAAETRHGVHLVASTHTTSGVQVVQSSSNETALLISGITGMTLIVVALINIFGPSWLKRRTDRDPKVRATSNEATNALLDELIEARKENERLRDHDRRHHETPPRNGDT